VTLTDQRNIALESAYQGTEYGNVERIVSSAGLNRDITFYPNADLSHAEILDYAGEEMGHLVALQLFDDWSPTDEEQWLSAMQADNITPHGRLTNQAEDFAELTGLWLLDQDKTRRRFPARVRLLEKWLRGHG